MIKYSFWEDQPKEETKKSWRVCLGSAPSCKKRVLGFKGDRLCRPCMQIRYHERFKIGRM